MPRGSTRAGGRKPFGRPAPAPVVPDKDAARVPRGKKPLQTIRGFRDILPDEQPYWEAVRTKAASIARAYGFMQIDVPIVEDTNLFVRSVGKHTDIVSKEMFSWEDISGDALSLRPEATASVARAYIQHGLITMPQPVKLYTVGPMFRHEKPQAGRHRQFHQLNFEVIGESSAIVDAQLIFIGYTILSELGIETSIQLNSVGSAQSRQEYLKHLVTYYKSKSRLLCEDCKLRIQKNPLRLLDCKNEQCQTLKAEAPQILDHLDQNDKDHFFKVLEYLDELNVTYALNPFLVRGLDYYTRTAFEYLPASADLSSQSALGGGGRYDDLISLLGGRENTPACGLALGIERVVNAMRQQQVEIVRRPPVDVFVAQLGEPAKKRAMLLFEELRKQDIRVAEMFVKDNLKAQLELANKLNVRYTLIIGQKELAEGTIMLREMEGGVQEIVDLNRVVKVLQKKLEQPAIVEIPLIHNNQESEVNHGRN